MTFGCESVKTVSSAYSWRYYSLVDPPILLCCVLLDVMWTIYFEIFCRIIIIKPNWSLWKKKILCGKLRWKLRCLRNSIYWVHARLLARHTHTHVHTSLFNTLYTRGRRLQSDFPITRDCLNLNVSWLLILHEHNFSYVKRNEWK